MNLLNIIIYSQHDFSSQAGSYTTEIHDQFWKWQKTVSGPYIRNIWSVGQCKSRFKEYESRVSSSKVVWWGSDWTLWRPLWVCQWEPCDPSPAEDMDKYDWRNKEKKFTLRGKKAHIRQSQNGYTKLVYNGSVCTSPFLNPIKLRYDA